VPSQTFDIRPIDVRAASADEYAHLNTFENILRFEVLPEDPPVPLSEDVARWKSTPSLIEEVAWAVWGDTPARIRALGIARIHHTGSNEHVLEFMIEVLPEFRRQGLGSRLLSLIADQARTHNRRLLTCETNDRVPAAGEFLARIGGRRGLEARLNQLRLADIDRGLVQRWLEQSRPLNAEFSLGTWEQCIPDERLQAVSELLQVVGNDQPRGNLEMEDDNYSPEIIRQFEAMMLAGGQQHRMLYAMDRRDGRLAGLTEVYWNPNRPAVLQQAFTGVWPDYRSRGLGRWLKAEMLNRVMQEWPQLEVIRTGNANSNAPMLKINVDLGFKPFIAWTIWQTDLDSVEKYLAGRLDGKGPDLRGAQ
jgi:mycothiol synthase